MNKIKYEFKTIKDDDLELDYTDIKGNEIKKPFKRDINFVKEYESVTVKARLKMALDMTKQGVKKSDLVLETKNADGTTTMDDSNFKIAEETYQQIMAGETTMKMVEESFKMKPEDLLKDMGINSQDEAAMFAQKYLNIMMVNEKDKGEEKIPS